MKIDTSELIGLALDWAVAKCEGYGGENYLKAIDLRYNAQGKVSAMLVPIDREYIKWLPSTDWSQGGPIIDSEGISIIRCDDDYGIGSDGYANVLRIPVWCATNGRHGIEYSTDHQSHEAMYQVIASEVFHGPSSLIAAMRCYVASKLGYTVEVPNELLTNSEEQPSTTPS